MVNKKLIYIICISLMVNTLMNAQDKKSDKAKKEFDTYSYIPAIEAYEALIEKGYSEEDIYKNLGDANYQNANYSEAANWFKKLFELNDATIEANYLYLYAQSLKSTKDYNAAALWMDRYETAKNAEERAKKSIANPDYLDQIESLSGRYDIKSLSINSEASDFAPAFLGEELVFSTARDSGTVTKFVHTWNNKPFTNLYRATETSEGDFGNPTKLSSLNKKTHETSAVFTKDGSTVYFTRNNSVNGKFSRDNQGVSRLKIYRANLNDGNWTNIVELPFNSDEYSAAHPTLSPDERSLYFASDMPGTHGASDIFVVEINENGNFGAPKNLGNTVNTEGRETFPFVTDTNVLYFASDGHPGLGGLDVFATKLDDMDNIYVVNTGKPVNSELDDFSFIINSETRKGFFASNREGGQGSDDIYAFTENEPIDLICNTIVSGIVKDEKDGLPLVGARVALVNIKDETLSEVITNADGSFVMDGDCRDGDYKLIAVAEGYNRSEVDFTSVDANDNTGIEILLAKVLQEAPVGTDLAYFLNLNPVYFDLDKSNIRADAATTLTAVIGYLNEFPDMKIQVQSHTDVRASKWYNNRLSDRRAKSTVDYLIANGISESRVKGKGFGESQLANDCTSVEKCSDEEHEKNRRSEFIVME
jgi:outer membrane protein OmpA-like peptidoglycan-associated protein/tetratricopeptide (TPR) repeat protein